MEVPIPVEVAHYGLHDSERLFFAFDHETGALQRSAGATEVPDDAGGSVVVGADPKRADDHAAYNIRGATSGPIP